VDRIDLGGPAVNQGREDEPPPLRGEGAAVKRKEG
jgi:hypothetical protein